MSDGLLVIECDQVAGGALREEIQREIGRPVKAASRDNLDATLPTLILMIEAGAALIAALTPLIVRYLDGSRVTKVRFGGLVIHNPTAEQWEVVLEQAAAGRPSQDVG